MKEIWKTIDKYEGSYTVSNTGHVKSMPRTVVFNNHFSNHRRFYHERILRPLLMTGKPSKVRLYREGQGRTYDIGYLVLCAFGDETPTKYHRVSYKDGDNRNPNINNLKWKIIEDKFKLDPVSKLWNSALGAR